MLESIWAPCLEGEELSNMILGGAVNCFFFSSCLKLIYYNIAFYQLFVYTF